MEPIMVFIQYQCLMGQYHSGYQPAANRQGLFLVPEDPCSCQLNTLSAHNLTLVIGLEVQ
jgi:hypothetical protein